jgi:hypothetical protein
MPYDPIYSSDAEAFIDVLPAHLQQPVLDEIKRLADDPVYASAPPSGPLWPSRQIFFFEVDDDKDCLRTFAAAWEYDADEQYIWILSIIETYSQGPDSGPH